MSYIVLTTLAMINTLLKIIQPTHRIDWLKCANNNDNHSSQNHKSQIILYVTFSKSERYYG